MMTLKAVVPDVEKTFGKLEFAGEGDVVKERVNRVQTITGRSFHLFSSVQRADDVVVLIPGSAGEKRFDYEEEISLVNPRITVEGYRIGERGYSNYILLADDIVKAGQQAN